jgi:hypothetical protein
MTAEPAPYRGYSLQLLASSVELFTDPPATLDFATRGMDAE